MKSLCIIIPTCNRTECIALYLKTIAKTIENKNIYVVIYDSSDENGTKKIVEKYSLINPNIIYDEYYDKGELKAIDHKVYSAYQKYYDKCDYMWFSGDGAILNLEQYYNDIYKFFEESFDLIITDCKDCHFDENKIYNNVQELFLECCWFMTLLSSVIVSKEIAKRIVEKYPYNSDNEEWLWIPTVYFRELIDNDYSVIHYSNNKIYTVNSRRTDSFWREQKNAIWQWSTAWCHVIEKQIPENYNNQKKEVLKSFDKKIHTFSFSGLLRLKENENLTVKKVNENRVAIKKVTKMPIVVFYLIAILPVTNILKMIKKILKKQKNRRK